MASGDAATPRGASKASSSEVAYTAESAVDINGALGSISDMLKEKQLRVIDLFRNPHFNPAYLANRHEQFDAGEVASVMAKAGLTLSTDECKMLIKVLDKNGAGILDATGLDTAVRKFRRGCREWPIFEKAQPRPSTARRATCTNVAASLSADEDGAAAEAEVPGMKAMSAITALLDRKHLRLQDLFRHPAYNPAYLHGVGDEAMGAKGIHCVLKKAGLDLPFADIKHMLECLDEDGSGTLDITELENALRSHRRGNIDWEALAQTAIANRKEKKVVNMDHLHSLSDKHKLKMDRLRDLARQKEEAEDQQIEEAKERARMGTRAYLTDRDFDPHACSSRLYQGSAEQEERRQRMKNEFEQKEQERINAEIARTRRRRSASVPDLQREADPRSIGERLYGHREAKDRDLRMLRAKCEADMLSQIDLVGQKLSARGVSSCERHKQLYEDAKDRRERLEVHARKNLEAEHAHRAEQMIGKGREALTPSRMTRIHELHEESVIRDQRRQEMAQQQMNRDKAEIEQAAVRAREMTSKKREQVKSKLRDCAPFKAGECSEISGSECFSPRKNDTKHPVGFGTAVPRKWLLGNEQKSTWCIESVDHALSTLCSMVAARCNCMPNEAQLEVLRDLVEPLKTAIQEYRDATGESELGGEGVTSLRAMSSKRLFACGNLLDDNVGAHECCEPDPIRQLESDFDKLMELADRAQAALLSAVGPEGKCDMGCIAKRWPVGARWNHPRATKKAHFAVNAGAKSKERATAKAFVRYAPAENNHRYRHLTDLARCALIFVDATMLRAGIEQIIERFEVIDVRNYYHASCQNLLGSKHVEVLVVIKCPEPFICEIRLEEMSYMIARERAQKQVDKIATVFADMYSGNGANSQAIQYLVNWILNKPKESHAVTVFKKHLARRFGSTVAAWRKSFGNGALVPFQKFREACQEIKQRHRCVEFWQSLDSCRGGCISLFELDPEAMVLLIKLYWRVLGCATKEQLADPEALFARLTTKSVVKLNSPGKLEAHEFRRVMKPLGFSVLEADRLFVMLDSHGGDGFEPPATVFPSDIGWLQRLPKLVDIQSVMLKDDNCTSDMDSLRALTSAGRAFQMEGRRARTPAMARGSVRGSMISSTGIPQATMFARRSVSVGSARTTPRNSLFNPVARSSQASIAAQEQPPQSPRSSGALLASPVAPATPASLSGQAATMTFKIPATPAVQRNDSELTVDACDTVEVDPPAAPSTAPPASPAQSPKARGAAAKPAAPAPAAGAAFLPTMPALGFGVGDVVRVAEPMLDARKVMVRKGQQGKVVNIVDGDAPYVLVRFSAASAPQNIGGKDVAKLALVSSAPSKDVPRVDSSRSTQPDSQRSKDSSAEGVEKPSIGFGFEDEDEDGEPGDSDADVAELADAF